MEKHYYRLDWFRLVLAFFVCVASFGLPGAIGDFIRMLSSFAANSFFILSGFFLLRIDDLSQDKLKRAIRRTAIFAAVLLICYLLGSAVFYALMGVPVGSLFRSAFLSKRIWFELIVLNNWPFPVGENVWFILCLLGSYIVVYLLERLNLLRFDWVFCILGFLATLFTGELAGLIGFHVLGYSYFPGMFLNRGVPYLLLGRIMGRSRKRLNNVKPIKFWGMVPLGALLAFAEVVLLGYIGKLVYTGHLFGIGVISFGLCAVMMQPGQWNDDDTQSGNYFIDHIPGYVKFIYAVHQPLGIMLQIIVALIPAASGILPETCIVVYALSLLLAIFAGKAVERIRSHQKSPAAMAEAAQD